MRMHEYDRQAAANDAGADIAMLIPGERADAPGVLVVSPDDAIRQATALYLRLAGGYPVLATRTLEGATARELPFQPALMLVHAPRRQALSAALLQDLRGRTGAGLILLTTDPDAREFEALHALAPHDIFLMPADPEILMDAIEDALHASRRT